MNDFPWAGYDRWQNPPLPHHRDGSVIPPECPCPECHRRHVEDGYFFKQYGHPDFECCTEEVNDRIVKGRWCGKKPKEHKDTYMKAGQCLECEFETSTTTSTRTGGKENGSADKKG